MAETNCPICQKPLINGRCNDCGYYVDSVVMDNQKDNYYTERKPQQQAKYIPPANSAYTNPNSTYNSGSQNYSGSGYNQKSGSYESAPLTKETKTLLIIVSFFVPIIGLILGAVYAKNSSEENKKFSKTLIIVAAVAFAMGFILPMFSALFDAFVG